MLRRCKADVVEFLGSVMYNEITEAKEVFSSAVWIISKEQIFWQTSETARLLLSHNTTQSACFS